ncbi:MAG: hypothetical protein ACR2MS_07695 [Weeksellaceae bacterium]
MDRSTALRLLADYMEDNPYFYEEYLEDKPKAIHNLIESIMNHSEDEDIDDIIDDWLS